MKALQTLSGWILCFVIAFLELKIVAVSAAYSMEETCEHIREGFIADPSSCQGYGYCENNRLVSKGNCPKGYIYNSRRGSCDFPNGHNCFVANVHSICQYAPDKSLVADPDNCAKFCQCVNKKAECNSCPKFQVYNAMKQECVWSSQLDRPCLADSICRLAKDGTFAGNPDQCGGYVPCVDGTGTPSRCEVGFFFNEKTGNCENKNPCNGSVNVPNAGPGITAPLPTDKNKCTENYDAKKGGAQYIADGKTCFGFYYCTDETGPGLWSKCPPNLHFNEGECVTPFTFPCKYDRCGNLNQTFVGAVGSECHNYLYCINQIANSAPDYTGTPCANGGFFNEQIGVCTTTNPADNKNYKLCTSPSPKPGSG